MPKTLSQDVEPMETQMCKSEAHKAIDIQGLDDTHYWWNYLLNNNTTINAPIFHYGLYSWDEVNLKSSTNTMEYSDATE